MFMRELILPTAARVAQNTNPKVNAAVRAETLSRLRAAADSHGYAAAIRRTECAWDTERVLEANATALILASLALGIWKDRRWLWLTGAVAAFLLQHAVQGFCPPLPVIRRLGIQTAEELANERLALRLLRGDFSGCVPEMPEKALLEAENYQGDGPR